MREYNNVDKQLHWLCQTIAKANRTYVSKKEDDSHTNLYFDVLGNRIIGRWIKAPKGDFTLSFNLVKACFEWVSPAHEVLQSVAIVGQSITEIEETLCEGIREMGLDPIGFTDNLHFEIPTYAFANAPVSPLDSKGIEIWKQYREVANASCALVLGHLQVQEEIRIWPHHFDTGIYVKLISGLGIGFGFAMEDGLAGSPYFYVAGYPENEALDYSGLPHLGAGRWEIGENWKGAILPANTIQSLNSELSMETIHEFLAKTLNWFIKN